MSVLHVTLTVADHVLAVPLHAIVKSRLLPSRYLPKEIGVDGSGGLIHPKITVRVVRKGGEELSPEGFRLLPVLTSTNQSRAM